MSKLALKSTPAALEAIALLVQASPSASGVLAAFSRSLEKGDCELALHIAKCVQIENKDLLFSLQKLAAASGGDADLARAIANLGKLMLATTRCFSRIVPPPPSLLMSPSDFLPALLHYIFDLTMPSNFSLSNLFHSFRRSY